MSEDDPVRFVAKIILNFNPEQLKRLRVLLTGDEGDPAGVGAVIPPNLPLKEGGAEVPFEEWPEEYWESQT